MKKLLCVVLVVFIATTLFTGCNSGSSQSKNQLEIFSWWTAGGEANGLNKMYEIYKKQYPGVEIINATVAGGAGSNAKAVLKTRMMGNDPPDSFQLHAGKESLDWVKDNKLEPIDDIYQSEELEKVFPKGLLDILKIDGHYYSVPVNIHRSNVIWYNKKIFADNNIEAPSEWKDWDDFFKAADKLKEKKITPLALGDNGQWTDVHLFESILLSVLGADDYNGLFSGKIDWNSDKVKDSLELFKKVLKYINDDHSALTWDQAGQYVIDGKAAMTVMGDWIDGDFIAKSFKDFGWAPSPGTKGTFIMLSDSFCLPKGTKHPENAKNWLKVCGSAEGQDAFNPPKGSIPARTDAGKGEYDEYLKSAMKDWAKDKLSPSIAHGAACSEGWVTQILDAIGQFVTKQDVADTHKKLIDAAEKYK